MKPDAYVFSSTKPGKYHRVRVSIGVVMTCTCPSGRSGETCWHKAVVQKLVDCGTMQEINERWPDQTQGYWSPPYK